MRLLLGLVFTLFATVAMATSSPIPPWYAAQAGSEMRDPVGNGKNAARMVKFSYDPAIDGGAVGNHFVKFGLPANALLLRSFAYVVRGFTGSSGSTIAAGCEDPGNIFPATNINQLTAGRVLDGNNSLLGTLTFASSIAAGCVISTAVGTAAATAGKIDFYLEYVVRDAN